MERFLTDSTDL